MDAVVNLSSIIPGYRAIEQLYSGSRTFVYRAIRNTDRYPAIIKLLQREYPSFNELLQLSKYTMAKNLQLPEVVETYSLESYLNSYALVMDDFGDISLKEYSQINTIELDRFFAIALPPIEILSGLYHKYVIHKYLKLANILINRKTKSERFKIQNSKMNETGDLVFDVWAAAFVIWIKLIKGFFGCYLKIPELIVLAVKR